MEQLLTTPVRRLAVVLGKRLPYVLLGLVVGGVVIAVGAHLSRQRRLYLGQLFLAQADVPGAIENAVGLDGLNLVVGPGRLEQQLERLVFGSLFLPLSPCAPPPPASGN